MEWNPFEPILSIFDKILRKIDCLRENGSNECFEVFIKNYILKRCYGNEMKF